MSNETRVFPVADHIKPSDGDPIRSVVLKSAESVVLVWHVNEGQEIAAHIHPQGQDTWTVLSGEGEYFQGNGKSCRLKAGDIAVALKGQVHGVKNTGAEPFVFVSVVAPANAGYETAGK